MKPEWPEWRGEDLAGKRLAVIGEQGFGDQIMFARFLAPLHAMGAEVSFVCAKELASLLGGQASLRRRDFDLWCYQLSLPLRLGTTLETVPPPVSIPVARRGGGGVGVMPTGNPGFLNNAHRTPPADVQAGLLAQRRCASARPGSSSPGTGQAETKPSPTVFDPDQRDLRKIHNQHLRHLKS